MNGYWIFRIINWYDHDFFFFILSMCWITFVGFWIWKQSYIPGINLTCLWCSILFYITKLLKTSILLRIFSSMFMRVIGLYNSFLFLYFLWLWKSWEVVPLLLFSRRLCVELELFLPILVDFASEIIWIWRFNLQKDF